VVFLCRLVSFCSHPMRQTMAVETETQQFTLAGIEVSATLLEKFVESFDRFNLDAQTLRLPSRDISNCGKIRGCVLLLTKTAVGTLKEAAWFAPRRTLIYGVGNSNEAWRFGHLGMNVLVQSKSDAGVRAAVDATQALICRGIGECARVPIALPVRVDALRKAMPGITRNIGSGGMAIELFRKTALPLRVALGFALPGSGSLILAASPRWYSGNLVGLQFEPTIWNTTVEQWVQQYARLGAVP
jgi:hypothetical protein